MLKRFYEMFFPGFSLFHGFALWDVGSAIGAGASILGGMMGDDASGDAADAQSASAYAAMAEMQKAARRTNKQTQPYRAAGGNSVRMLSDLLGTTFYVGYRPQNLVRGNGDGTFRPNEQLMASSPEYRAAWKKFEARTKGKDLTSSEARLKMAKIIDLDSFNEKIQAKYRQNPQFGSLLRSFSEDDLANDVVYNKGLEFGLNEGNKAIERNATRFGNLDSGATLKALTRFGNDYGETKSAGAQARWMGDKAFTLGSLMGTSGMGLNAVNTNANAGMMAAQGMGNALMGAGNAQAAGIMGGANAWSDALSGVGNMFGGGSRGGSSWPTRTPPYVPQYAGGGVDLSRYYA